MVAAIIKKSPIVNVGNLQRETDPLDVDPFAFIDVWSSDLMPCKIYESIHNRPFTHFEEAVAKFQRLAFDQPLEDSFSNPNYKPQL